MESLTESKTNKITATLCEEAQKKKQKQENTNCVR